MNKRIILVGPSAAGKNFIRQKFIEKGFSFDVSYTTRKPRNGEINGIDYIFISDEEFTRKINENFFYEWVNYGENKYGTGKYEFENKDIFIMETEAINNLKPEDRINSLVIFVNTPEHIRIERMKERGWNEEKIQERIKIDKEKFENFTNFDLQISSV